MTKQESSHYDWLLEKLADILGREVARGTLDSLLASLGHDMTSATEQNYRALLRGPLQERLRLRLGGQSASAWVTRTERERFGPERSGSAAATRISPLGRRGSDAALALALLRVEIAEQQRRRAELAEHLGAAERLAVRHEEALARLEVRQLQTQDALSRQRDAHARQTAWLSLNVVRARKRLLALQLKTATTRGVAEQEVEAIKLAWRGAREHASALEALGVPEVTIDDWPKVTLSADVWLAHLDEQPSVLHARQTAERASAHLQAASAHTRATLESVTRRAEGELEAARASVMREARGRLANVRAAFDEAERLRAAHARAQERVRELEQALASGPVDELAFEEAQHDAVLAWSAAVQASHTLARLALELRAFLGLAPEGAGA
ncbi:hypothetical protein [Deinococcus yavapaiensis]|uniref:Uncharacterized protein n=1 Tax=Deinococcus yavapaiensis KR-236 TaxID=694435 RepID=A0A318SE38_9DEIO|nr:hypothetical protein [Deinococcus yavapaiensis]PYE55331.1 hypothetical protein DES52_103164 [Deinococcus yavapaiensis KR-236]